MKKWFDVYRVLEVENGRIEDKGYRCMESDEVVWKSENREQYDEILIHHVLFELEKYIQSDEGKDFIERITKEDDESET